MGGEFRCPHGQLACRDYTRRPRQKKGNSVQSDQALLIASQRGDRGAFGELVKRYQTLVASIAYSRTGDLDRSEEIAQQTFVTAWEKRDSLRDHQRMVAWLSGIARNLTRQESRQRSKWKAGLQESVENMPAGSPSPVEQCISGEQEALLWQVLQQIPETYREPLVLYHREHHSVSEVARLLELSEDAVKQRLSRGRTMLKREVASFVEKSLAATRPDATFVAGVMAALPPSGPALAAASAAGGKVATKVVGGKLLFGLGPLIGFAGAAFGTWNSLRQATSSNERRLIWKLTGGVALLVGGLWGMQAIVRVYLPEVFHSAWFQIILWTVYLLLLFALILVGNRAMLRVKEKFGSRLEKESLNAHGMMPLTDASFQWQLVGMASAVPCLAILYAVWAADWQSAVLMIAAWFGLYAYARWIARTLKSERHRWAFLIRVSLAATVLGGAAILIRGNAWSSRMTHPGWAHLSAEVSTIAIVCLSAVIAACSRFQMLSRKQESPPESFGAFRLTILVPLLLILVGVSGVRLLGSSPSHSVTAFQLENGLRVRLKSIPGAQQTVVMTLFDVGELDDPAGCSGLGHLVEHVYVTAANGRQPQRTVQQFVQAYPQGWNAQTGSDYTVIATVVGPERLEAELQDAAARMRQLDIRQSDLDREIPRVLQEVNNMFERVPPLVARNWAREQLHSRPNSGRHGGAPDQVQKLRVEKVREHWQRFYKPANAMLLVVGKFDPELASKKVQAHFDDIPSGDKTPARGPSRPAKYENVDKSVAGTTSPIVLHGYACPPPGHELYPPFLAIVAQLQQASREIQSSPNVFPVQFAPLDDSDTVYLQLEAANEADVMAASNRLRKVVDEVDLAKPSRAIQAARQQFAMLGAMKMNEAVWARNVYGAAFSMGRCEQLGIRADGLQDALQAITEDSLRKCHGEFFSKAKLVEVIVH